MSKISNKIIKIKVSVQKFQKWNIYYQNSEVLQHTPSILKDLENLHNPLYL